MKLTNKQLKQIIKEELSKVLEAYRPHHSIRPPEFDSRSEKEYPQHSKTLSDMYMSDDGRSQARELAQGLRYDDELPDDEQVVEPIDIPVDASRTEDDLTFPIFDKSKDRSFDHRYSDSGIELHLYWDPRKQKFVVSYQIPYGYPGGGGGQGGFIEYDDYQEALKRYKMIN